MDCDQCKYRINLTPLGQGVFCINNNNKNKVLDEDRGIKHNGWPFLPGKFVCEYFTKRQLPYEISY